MELWYSENHTESAKFSIKVDKQLVSVTSAFQRIDVFESYDFGRFLTLDGFIMLTEKDEFIYHEMITHVPMSVHPSAKRILVVGGGDGGVIRELARYDSIEHIDLVEIDRAVVEICREYLPRIACSFDDPRVRIHYEDGLEFVRRRKDEYDLIIVDSTDPIGPGERLFTEEFYYNCHQALHENGVMTNQQESPFYPGDAAAMQRAHKYIAAVFPVSLVYQAHIPTYPSGHFLFGFASKTYHPIADRNAVRWETLGLKTRYYNARLHAGAFALPNYVKELLQQAR